MLVAEHEAAINIPFRNLLPPQVRADMAAVLWPERVGDNGVITTGRSPE